MPVVGSDEGPGFERLRKTGEKTYGRREKFGLGDFFKGLPGKDKDEADVESISIHKGWLWLVTSHACTRPKLRDEQTGLSDVEAFAKPEFHPRRYVLGRIPLVGANGETPTPVERDGKRQAWCVPVSASGSALTEALAQDDHLKRAPAVPAKENGLDIEGVAVRDGRIVLGLRGPVLRGEAILLDLDLPSHGVGIRPAVGVTGRVGGVALFLGSPQMAAARVALSDDAARQVEALNDAGKTVSVLLAGGKVRA